MKKQHYIALVPMGGKHDGKIAQHSTMQENIEAAAKWAKKRFSRNSILVEMNSEDDVLPLSGDAGNRHLYMVQLDGLK